METEKEIDKIKNSLKDLESRISKMEGTIGSNASGNVKKFSGLEGLIKRTNLKEDDIKIFFDTDGSVLIPLEKLGKGDREKIINITLLTLLGCKYLLRESMILAKDLRRRVEENGVPTNNFATYLREITPSLIRRKGETKSPKTTYEIKPLGETRAKNLIIEMTKTNE